MAKTYQDAGVNVEAGYEAVAQMKQHAASTFNENVISGLGSFGAMYQNGDNVLVSGTDGVGTKLKAAFAMDKHDTIGIDCVAMCANDVVCHGAAPMFFLDYIATGKLVPSVAASIVSGVANGCRQAGCALIGGETAEMPGFYSDGEYDMAGFCVGSVQKTELINGSGIKEGDVLIGLASSGIHSNGFSLVRALVEMTPQSLSQQISEFGHTMGEELLTPTRIYVKTLLSLFKDHEIKGAAHITGGGFFENIPRMLPEGIGAQIQLGSWPVLPIFQMLMHKSELSLPQALETFNMGIGMVIAVSESIAQDVLSAAISLGEQAYVIGNAVSGKGVSLCE